MVMQINGYSQNPGINNKTAKQKPAFGSRITFIPPDVRQIPGLESAKPNSRIVREMKGLYAALRKKIKGNGRNTLSIATFEVQTLELKKGPRGGLKAGVVVGKYSLTEWIKAGTLLGKASAASILGQEFKPGRNGKRSLTNLLGKVDRKMHREIKSTAKETAALIKCFKNMKKID